MTVQVQVVCAGVKFKKSSHSLNVSSLKTGLKALIYVLILTLFCVLSSLTLAVLLLWWNSPKTMKLDCRVCGKAYDRGADQPSKCVQVFSSPIINDLFNDFFFHFTL